MEKILKDSDDVGRRYKKDDKAQTFLPLPTRSKQSSFLILILTESKS